MKQVNIFILIDALGWDLLKQINFLTDLCPFRNKVASVFGFSSAALPTIYTGLYPDEHQRWGMWYYSPEKSPFRKTKYLHSMPEFSIGNKNITRWLIQNYYKKYSGISEYFCIYDIPIRHLHKFALASVEDIYEPGAFSGRDSIFDLMTQDHLNYFKATWRNNSRPAFINAENALINGVDGCFIYTAEFDALLHKYGPDVNNLEIRKKLAEFDRAITQLYEIAKNKYGKVNLCVFSDHGMANVNREIDIIAQIKELNLVPYKDFIAFYDSTMARFYFHNEKARNKIREALQNSSHGKILTKNNIKAERVYFSDSRYGELIFVCDAGVVINPSLMSSRAPKGMHGYLPDDSSADAIFLMNCELPEQSDPMHIKDYYRIIKNLIKSQDSN